jgi:hypothetical protein
VTKNEHSQQSDEQCRVEAQTGAKQQEIRIGGGRMAIALIA